MAAPPGRLVVIAALLLCTSDAFTLVGRLHRRQQPASRALVQSTASTSGSAATPPPAANATTMVGFEPREPVFVAPGTLLALLVLWTWPWLLTIFFRTQSTVIFPEALSSNLCILRCAGSCVFWLSSPARCPRIAADAAAHASTPVLAGGCWSPPAWAQSWASSARTRIDLPACAA